MSLFMKNLLIVEAILKSKIMDAKVRIKLVLLRE